MNFSLYRKKLRVFEKAVTNEGHINQIFNDSVKKKYSNKEEATEILNLHILL